MTRLGPALATLALVTSSLLACGGRLAGEDLTSPPPDGADPPEGCPAIAPACDPGDEQVDSEAACGRAGSCYSRSSTCQGSRTTIWCAGPTERCLAEPTCDAGDRQVTSCASGETCYTRTTCGSTILCARPKDACKALPTCDPGDVEVTKIDTCEEEGVSCYSRTTCGVTIWCADVK